MLPAAKMALESVLPSLSRRHRHNLSTLRRQPLAEMSGALGDLGTLLPLMIALAQAGSVSLSSTLVFSGVFNILTGAVFGIPLPVQPMKAIAAEAIAGGYARGEVLAAGAWTALAVLVLAATGGLRWLGRVVPVPVVRGIQMGAGLQLAGSSRSRVVGPERTVVFAVLAVALVAVFVLGTARRGRAVPFALVLFVAGVAWAAARIAPGEAPGWAPWRPDVAVPAWLGGDVADGGLRVLGMALGQIPLTTLNSVIAVSALAGDLLPDFAVGVTGFGLSVAAMNLVGCWFGAMPTCHGAGGLAAQWRFGARSGASVMMLGVMKLVLGLVLGDSLAGLVAKFPGPVLGVMVLGAGLELARVAVGVNEGAMDLYEDQGEEDSDGVVVPRRKQRVLDDAERTERWMVMLVTTAGIVSFHNDAVGFAGGMLCHWFYRLVAWWDRRRQGTLRL